MQDVSARDVHRRSSAAEVLGEDGVLALDAPHIRVIGAGRVDRAVDHVEPLVQRGVFIQAQFKILPRAGVEKKHSAPFDVEDAVGRAT